MTDRPVTLSPKVWADLRRELDALHAFIQRVAEQSHDPALVEAAVKLGADRT